MQHYEYLIIGGGLTGDAAVRGIREIDNQGTIGMFSMESDPPYARPALSKGLWKGRPIEKIWRNTQSLGVDLFLDKKIVSLDVNEKNVCDAQGVEYSYDKLLLATGCSPIKLPSVNERIIYFRNLEDYRQLRSLSEVGEKFLVIGGGFTGSEIAAALNTLGKKVEMVFFEDSIGANIFPADLSQFVNNYYLHKGVEILSNDAVENISNLDEHFVVHTRSGKVLEVDGIVAGIGVRPNVELAQKAGLSIDNGIKVDRFLQTSSTDVYSAGDVANFLHTALQQRMRVEHEDNSIQMGKQAGRNMAGANETYDHSPIFYSDMFDLGYEAIGKLSSKLETIVDWKEPFKEGVIYYLENGQVCGILMWNVWDVVTAARTILLDAANLKKSDLNLQLLLDRKH